MQIHSPSASRSAILACLLAGLCGCGESDGLPREPVSGQVTIEGKPLPSGLITFVPDSPDVPTQGGGPVVEGRYSITRSQGLVPGKYKVVISSSEDEGAEKFPDEGHNNNAPGMPPTPRRERIPKDYNVNSKLTAEVVAGKNEIDFDIVASAKK